VKSQKEYINIKVNIKFSSERVNYDMFLLLSCRRKAITLQPSVKKTEMGNQTAP
jgi:hypothetical protein